MKDEQNIVQLAMPLNVSANW